MQTDQTLSSLDFLCSLLKETPILIPPLQVVPHPPILPFDQVRDTQSSTKHSFIYGNRQKVRDLVTDMLTLNPLASSNLIETFRKRTKHAFETTLLENISWLAGLLCDYLISEHGQGFTTSNSRLDVPANSTNSSTSTSTSARLAKLETRFYPSPSSSASYSASSSSKSITSGAGVNARASPPLLSKASRFSGSNLATWLTNGQLFVWHFIWHTDSLSLHSAFLECCMTRITSSSIPKKQIASLVRAMLLILISQPTLLLQVILGELQQWLLSQTPHQQWLDLIVEHCADLYELLPEEEQREHLLDRYVDRLQTLIHDLSSQGVDGSTWLTLHLNASIEYWKGVKQPIFIKHLPLINWTEKESLKLFQLFAFLPPYREWIEKSEKEEKEKMEDKRISSSMSTTFNKPLKKIQPQNIAAGISATSISTPELAELTDPEEKATYWFWFRYPQLKDLISPQLKAFLGMNKDRDDLKNILIRLAKALNIDTRYGHDFVASAWASIMAREIEK